jgi:uncharacterized membrane protein
MGDESVEMHNAERLKFFTDAVVAIALTLLVLPLLESVPEAATRGDSTGQWLGEHSDQLVALFVSFAVVSTYWMSHHRIFEHVARYTPLLMRLSFGWMLAVVFLQVPTALVYALPTDRALVALYVGTMALGSAMLGALAWAVGRDPSCQYPGHPLPRETLRSALVTTALFAVALVVGVAVPAVNFYALLLLFLARPARLALDRWNPR